MIGAGAPSTGQKEFKGKLARTITIVLVVLSLLPATIISLTTYFRARDLLSEQASTQIESIVNNFSIQLQEIVNNNNTYLTQMVAEPTINVVINDLIKDSTSDTNRFLAWTQFSAYSQNTRNLNNTFADLTLLVDPGGTVWASSQQDLLGKNYSNLNYITDLLGKKTSTAVLNPEPLFPGQWIIFTSTPILDKNQQIAATLVVGTNSPASSKILESAAALYPSAKAYYFNTKFNQLLGLKPGVDQPTIIQLASTDLHLNQIRSILAGSQRPANFSTEETGAVFSFARLNPELNLAFVVEVPESLVFSPLTSLLPFITLVFVASLVAGILLSLLGTRGIVSPLTQLTERAQSFARGDWSARAKINRNDEIGLLGDSFNRMVEQISELYRSLEMKVEERTRQLRTASEVGQLATSASNREEIIQRAVRLIIDRFGFSFASFFSSDDASAALILQEFSSMSGESIVTRGYRIPLTVETLIGWVATNNQAQVIANTGVENIFSNEILLPNTHSEIALPVAIGSQVFGVLEVQSDLVNGFETDIVAVLQTLCNQIANGLQNLRLLEATQVNLEETSLLYRTSRQLSLTKNGADLFQTLLTALSQTPYVSGVFTVHEDHLSIMAITDPRSPTAIIATQGVTLPLQRIDSRLAQNALVLIENLSQPSEFDHILSFFSRRGCRSAAIFPVFEEKRLSRIIVLGSRSNVTLTQTSLQPFSNLVEVINTTLERFHVLDDLQHRVNELQTYTKLNEVISAETELANLYQVLHQEVTQMIGGDLSFAIALYDARKNTVQIPYLYENFEIQSIDPFPLGEGLTSIVIRNRKPLLLVKDTEAQAQALGAKVLGKPAKSWMGIPLIVGGEVVGVIILQDTTHEERFSQTDLNLFTTLAPQIGTAIRNAQLLSQMQEALAAYDQERFLLNSLMKNIPDQVTFKDQLGQFIRVSRSFANDFGVENPLDLIGKSISNLVEEAQAYEIQTQEQEILVNKMPILGMVQKDQVGEKERWQLTSKLPLEDDTGKVQGLLSISRNITELKQAEAFAQQRAEDLQIAAEIARDTSGSLQIEETLIKSVNLIRDRFGYYHASIFLLDPLGNYAVLREAPGEVGEKMKAAGHRLAVGSQSIVGQATYRRETLVINEVRAEPNYYPNPLLPETRAELAIPLTVGDRLLGCIDVQSRLANAFTHQVVSVLEILADQLAVAVLNATLFARTQDNLGQHRLLHQITVAAASANSEDDALAITVEALRTSRGGGRVSIFLLNNQGDLEMRAFSGYEGMAFKGLVVKVGEGIVGKAALQRQPIRVEDTLNDPEYVPLDAEIRSELSVPILYSDRLIGILNLENTEPATYDETDQEILGSLGNTLGAILANAQLVRTVRQQIDRQRKLYEATSKIRRTVDVQSILTTSASEICKALGARRAHIEITAGKDDALQETGSNGNGHRTTQEEN